MRISIFGLGYVGCVSAACFAKNGHSVVGLDVSAAKRDILAAGRSPVVEKDLDELIAAAVASARLRTAASAAEAVAQSDVALVCVGTPSRANASLDLGYVARVCEEIGAALRSKNERHVVCIRSTMLPGSTEEVAVPALERGFGSALPPRVEVAVNPEFLREGSAVADFFQPPKTVVGAFNPKTAATIVELYQGIEAPVFATSIRIAETVKYVDNVFHATKITFANEIGTVCKAAGVDSHEVMRIFAADTKLNISPAYLKPGFAFGGSCLPKDVRALVYYARSRDLNLPLLSSLLPSNDVQVDRAANVIFSQGKKRLGFLGMSFKPGTDDLRESPLVRLIEICLGKGYDIRIYDQNVSLARLVGANKAYIETEIPHVSRLLSTQLDEVIAFADVVVVGHRTREFAEAVTRLASDKVIVDLVRVFDVPPDDARYLGFNW
jgi:GDP-mannose 6-dehydrogenase